MVASTNHNTQKVINMDVEALMKENAELRAKLEASEKKQATRKSKEKLSQTELSVPNEIETLFEKASAKDRDKTVPRLAGWLIKATREGRVEYQDDGIIKVSSDNGYNLYKVSLCDVRTKTEIGNEDSPNYSLKVSRGKEIWLSKHF